MNNIRTRFAPSPTGYLHIGSLRTVLFDYLLAKTKGGKLILRIEDTDRKRYVEGAIEKMIEILDWVGLKFDEGPHAGGDLGPYIQSERLEIYQKYLKELLDKKEAYYCFCTEERLATMRTEQQANKMAPRYDRHCRDLSEKEVAEKLQAGEKYVIRQKMPLSGEVVVHDELRGDIKFKAEDLDDQVLIKSDGIPTYHFALIIDDHLMQITDVIRGEEWIPSFPKNILLYRAFVWEPPRFYHMPLSLNKGGGKLSKRQGDVAVEDYKAKGYLPEALINFCALQGWHPKDDKEIFSLSELEQEFKIEDMGTSPAVFDLEKLDYYNGYYIRKKDINELTDLCIPFLIEANLIKQFQNSKFKIQNSDDVIGLDFIKNIVGLEQERLKKLSEIGELTKFFFVEPEYEKELLIWKSLAPDEIKNNLRSMAEFLNKIDETGWDKENLENTTINYLKNNNLKVGDYLWPMRVALSGQKASPGPFEIAEILGKNKTLDRLKTAINK
jgi:nondiscriminating glutamyl-tRNA synthetase